jgi:hypothetical protein
VITILTHSVIPGASRFNFSFKNDRGTLYDNQIWQEVVLTQVQGVNVRDAGGHAADAAHRALRDVTAAVRVVVLHLDTLPGTKQKKESKNV